MITVLTWMWDTRYSAAHVNALARQVARHYQKPHRFLCVTNQPEGIECETTPDTEDFKDTPSPAGPQAVTCYRRLRMFHPDAAQWFGERFVWVDLDMVVLDDISPLWDRDEDFVGLRDPLFPDQLNGSMGLLTAGSRPQVWEEFAPNSSPRLASRKGWKGSDQAWLSMKLLPCPTWGPKDGVYSFRKDGANPPGARIVSYHGRVKPWHTQIAA